MTNQEILSAWEDRSRKYGRRIEGVLPKSLPAGVNKYLHNWMFEQVVSVIPSKRKAKILDLGCGYGRLSAEILTKFASVQTVGVDIASEYVALYNKDLAGRGHGVKADITRLPFGDNSFEMTFMVTTLMYLVDEEEQRQAISELFRVLKPGGKFVIIERNLYGYFVVTGGGLVSLLRGKKQREIPAVSFTPGYMRKLITREGGKLTSCEGIPGWTILLPLSIVLCMLSNWLARPFLGKVVLSLDKLFNWVLTPSLYISYIGRKRG